MSDQREIPPDPEGMNDQRAEWADVSLKAFLAVCPDDDEAALHDLLCNLRHWADRNGADFDAVLRSSTRCYREEIASSKSEDDEEPASDGDEIIFMMPASRMLE